RIIRFGAFEADLEERELRKNGLRVKLHEKPFQVLELLATSQGETVTRKELCERLWPDTHVVFDRNLNAAVNKLRQTLRDSPRSPRFIETRSHRGYRFIAPVETGGLAPLDPQVRSAMNLVGVVRGALCFDWDGTRNHLRAGSKAGWKRLIRDRS